MQGSQPKDYTSTELFSMQRPYLQRGQQRAEALYGAGDAPYYPASTVAGLTTPTQRAQAGIMEYTGGPRPAAQQRLAEQQLGRTYDWAGRMPQVGADALQRAMMAGAETRGLGLQGLGAIGPTAEQMMTGEVPTGEGTPYGDLSDTYRDAVISRLTNPTTGVLQGIRTGLLNAGQAGGSSRGDMLQQQAITDAVTQGMAQPMAQMYGNAYQQAQAQSLPAAQQALAGYQQAMGGAQARGAMEAGGFDQAMGGLQQGAATGLAGAGMYPSIMNAPLDMYGAMGGVGAQQQAQNQAAIEADMARYQYPEQARRARVGEYIQNITGLGGSGGFGGLANLVTPPKTS